MSHGATGAANGHTESASHGHVRESDPHAVDPQVSTEPARAARGVYECDAAVRAAGVGATQKPPLPRLPPAARSHLSHTGKAQPPSRVPLSVTPRTAARQAPLPTGFPSEDTGLGCHSRLQGIFLSHTQTHLGISVYQGGRVEN